jgi:hypothetical protein
MWKRVILFYCGVRYITAHIILQIMPIKFSKTMGGSLLRCLYYRYSGGSRIMGTVVRAAVASPKPKFNKTFYHS